jgi:hypothetical protein
VGADRVRAAELAALEELDDDEDDEDASVRIETEQS